MSTVAAISTVQSLASVVRSRAAAIAAGGPACLWCESADVTVEQTSEWPRRPFTVCRSCGSRTEYDGGLTRRKTA